MLICNLAVLLAERGKNISTVSSDTGISRTTLTALSSNKSAGIQFETVNTLCSYLNISPGDLFLYSPIEIEPCGFAQEEESIHYLGNSVLYAETITFSFSRGWAGNDSKFSLAAEINAKFDAEKKILYVDMSFSRSNDENVSLLSELPTAFLTVLEKDIAFNHGATSKPLRNLIEKYPGSNHTKLKYSIHWPD